MSFGIDQRWLSQHLAATPGSRPADADFEEAAAAGALPSSSLALRCIPDPLPDCILGVAFSAIDAAAKSVPLQTAHDAVVGLLRNPAASPSSGANRAGAGGEMFMLIEACDMAKSLHDRVATQAAAIENQRQHCAGAAAGNTNGNAAGGTAPARPLPIPTVVNRSLQLLLSDGHRRVKAIEFPACPSLSALYPGVKIEIKRYRARGGMLLLGPEDGVVIHGGAVPRLVREYESKVATLAAALSGVPQSAQQQQQQLAPQQQPQLQLLPGQMPPAPAPGQHHQQQQQHHQVQVQGQQPQPIQQQQQGAQQQQQQQQHNGQAQVPPPPPPLPSVGLPPLAPGASLSRVSPPPLRPPPPLPQAQPVSPHVRPATATATDSFALVPGQGYVRTAPPPHQHPPLSNAVGVHQQPHNQQGQAQTHSNQQQPPRGSPPPTPTRPTVAPQGHVGKATGSVGCGSIAAASSVSIAAALGSPHRPQLVSSQNESQIVIDSQMSEATESCGKQRSHAAAASSVAGPASHDHQQGKDGPSVVRRPDMFDEGSISMTHLIDDEDAAAPRHQELQQHHKQQEGHHGGVSRGGGDGEIVLASSDDDSDDNVPLALRYPGLTPKREPAEMMTDGAHAKTSAKAIVKSEPLIDEEADQFARHPPPPPPPPQQQHLPPSTISSSSYGGTTTATATTTAMSTNPYSTIASSNRQSVGFLSQRVLESQQANADGSSGPPVIQLHGFINSLARGIKVLNNEWFSLLVLFDIGLPAGAAMQAESIRRNQQTTSAAPAAASANSVEQSLYQIDLGHTWVQAQLGMSAAEFLQLKHDKSLKHLYVAAMQQLSDRLSELGPVFVTLLMPDATAAMSASQQKGQNGAGGAGGGIPVVQSLQMEDLDWTRQALEGLLDEGEAGKYIDVG